MDPTRAERRTARRRRGHVAFLFRYGVLPVGLPAAIVLDLALLVLRGDLPLLLSADHALQLELLVLVVGVPAGLVAGRVLWRLAERRAAHEELTRAFDYAPAPAARAPAGSEAAGGA